MEETLVVRREQHVPAPPAVVFAFLTDPEKILRWMGTEANVEPHPGGLYLVNVTGARFARGSFREVVPVHRLAYSFGWDGSEVVPPGSSLVEIDLLEQPDGTLLRLTHTGLPSAEQCAGHAEGWAHYLGRLAEVAAGRDPGPDPRARPHRQCVTAFRETRVMCRQTTWRHRACRQRADHRARFWQQLRLSETRAAKCHFNSARRVTFLSCADNEPAGYRRSVARSPDTGIGASLRRLFLDSPLCWPNRA